MHRCRLACLAGVSTALLAGCGATPAQSSTLPLSSARLSPYAAAYRVQGPNSGVAAWTVQLATGGAVRVQLHTEVGKMAETDSLTLSESGLAPRSVREVLTEPGADVSIVAIPGKGSVHENAIVNGRHETPSIAIRAPWQANAALLVYLSGIRLEPGDSATIEDVVLKRATSSQLGLSVGRAVSVHVPAGTYRCYPVTISAGGAQQTAWYMTSAPHAMVQYANASVRYALTALIP